MRNLKTIPSCTNPWNRFIVLIPFKFRRCNAHDNQFVCDRNGSDGRYNLWSPTHVVYHRSQVDWGLLQ